MQMKTNPRAKLLDPDLGHFWWSVHTHTRDLAMRIIGEASTNGDKCLTHHELVKKNSIVFGMTLKICNLQIMA